ncbi:MAG: 3-dehydroquinate synthase II family protein [Pseudodesulfovibrio sp.]|uniref:3-dehydroquinate synthase n=1 Tax=Pseudodesulfovibrio aespoeensis (strain ATCC 700646 / DSM 10631 / Aspo-2) TaxID=643562 RepID=E6VSI7_PSEA9|nr:MULTISPECIES: 3-dehydroquinate synthase II family protein [Pseudodesulfovibrio]MBU4191710.1 3-dehydroquinate synthase II family protein [Pseudomonadota bacterium]ADU61972.1 3-dehydroquinate synthase [Pseudodesulfovibrio aespoeensis Aspo-2]MBU4242829.1 3-dehydroquinate synthase II family protein [Pseudomonadota bacterium]MBU4475006.1 3-dehydroquinate synthase II family protein [Pseudomonadota bacterium]MBU4516058.1 3-dehydroquinate synthase II family protein [Pseudomonadota bacterium]
MKTIIFKAIPFDKTLLTLALESGVDAVMVEKEQVAAVQALGRVTVITPKDLPVVALTQKSDEEEAVARIKKGENIVLAKGWEIIPVENILAQVDTLALECENLDRAILAAGILERGCDTIVVLPEGATDLKRIVAELKLSQGTMELETATITAIKPAGLGHRVCVDTISMLRRGQGMLVGNSSAFTFLVHAETESNPYVAARPFRVNAGAVHAYTRMPGDKTTYLEELAAGTDVLIVGADGSSSLATVGRVKVEVRPMLLVTAEVKDKNGARQGQVFLQNAETIRVVSDKGDPVSVVTLKVGDKILVKTDEAGRHFGMRIQEDIKEA